MWCLEFRKLELLTAVSGRSKGRYLINFSYGLSDKNDSGVLQFEVNEESRKKAEIHAEKIKALLESLDKETQLAALAHTSHLIAGES
jgi:hypothetical protein